MVRAVVEVIEMPVAAGYDMLEVRRPSGDTVLLPAEQEAATTTDAGDAPQPFGPFGDLAGR